MKKKVLLMLCMVALAVMLALGASAANIDGIDYSFENGEATVTSENKNCLLEIVNIPETVEYEGKTYTVTIIANSAFKDNTVVKEITTPSTIKGIYAHAFRSMTALTKVTLNASNSFKAFHDAEFYQCRALKSVDMSGCVGLTGIGDGGTYDDTFVDCTSLESVVLPKGINYIGVRAFFNCSKLGDIENLDFENVTYVGYKAFWGPKLTGDVILSENATYIGSHAFRDTNITSIVMRMGSDSTQTIMDDATFYGCKKLKYVVISSNIKTVGQYTFSGCSSLEYVVLGNVSTTFSTRDTFSGCGALKAIIYTGSEDSFKALSGISALGSLEYKSFSEYVHGTLPSTRTVYYGATTCHSCNGIWGNEGFIFTDLLSEMKYGKQCLHCNNEVVSQTYAPVFECLGYSVFEGDSSCSIVQGYRVNYTSISVYNEQAESDIEGFGLLAVAADEVDGTVFDQNGEHIGQGIVAPVAVGNEYFEIKVKGLSKDGTVDGVTSYLDAQIYMCAYVNVGADVQYISNGAVGSTLGTPVSYNTAK